MKRLKKILFWLHLAAGLTAGLVVALLCLTGVAMSFEEQLIALAESKTRAVSSGPTRLSLDELIERVAKQKPKAKLNALTVERDPEAPITVSLRGDDGWLHLDPTTGEP